MFAMIADYWTFDTRTDMEDEERSLGLWSRLLADKEMCFGDWPGSDQFACDMRYE